MELDTPDGRKQYLSDKLDNLLDGINDSYGKMLLEELIGRLETTIKDFNEEMKSLCDQLVKKEKERQQLLEMLKSGDGLPGSSPPGDSAEPALPEINEPEAEIPEWEKKLAKLEKK